MMSERSSQPGEPTPFDRAVRRTLQADVDTIAASPACLDAETMAAWADGVLTRDERAAAEQHAAGCPRCQAVLAALAITDPTSGRSGVATWLRLPALKWLVPATALASALVVWAVLPGRIVVQHDAAVDTIAENAPREVPIAPRVAAPPADNERGRAAPAPGETREEAGAPAARNGGVATESPAAAEPQRPTAAQSADAGSLETAPSTSGFAAAKPAAPAVTPSPSAAPAPSAAAPAQLAAKALRGAVAVPPQVTIVSSNPASRWRTLPGGAVQRSMDGGSTWELQQTGVTVTLVAGTSPSPSVCWLVGPSGTIVVTTDGRSWRRVTFPEAVDLVAIRSTDEGVAVTSSDGRAFLSEDGGATWTRE